MSQPIDAAAPAALDALLRQHAETQFAEELAALAQRDTQRQRPPNWRLSPGP